MVTINVRQKGCLKGWGDVCSGPWKPSPGAYHEEEREAGHGVDQQQEPPDGPNVRLVLAHLGFIQLSLWPLFYFWHAKNKSKFQRECVESDNQ